MQTLNKSTIKRKMESFVQGAGFINQQQIKRFMGCGNETVKVYTSGLSFVRLKRTKWYSTDDVAAKIVEYVEH